MPHSTGDPHIYLFPPILTGSATPPSASRPLDLKAYPDQTPPQTQPVCPSSYFATLLSDNQMPFHIPFCSPTNPTGNSDSKLQLLATYPPPPADSYRKDIPPADR